MDEETVVTRKFKSISGKPVCISSTSGLSYVVGADPVELPDVGDLHQAALNAKCYPVDDEQPATFGAPAGKGKKEKVPDPAEPAADAGLPGVGQ